jgi:hypothetical protein
VAKYTQSAQVKRHNGLANFIEQSARLISIGEIAAHALQQTRSALPNYPVFVNYSIYASTVISTAESDLYVRVCVCCV